MNVRSALEYVPYFCGRLFVVHVAAGLLRAEELVDALLDNERICAFCYTQLTDVEQEQNGIFTYDRKPKFEAAKLKAIFGKVPAWAQPKKK